MMVSTFYWVAVGTITNSLQPDFLPGNQIVDYMAAAISKTPG
jgi:hypothetical protein